MGDSIRVLHVDDEPDLAELASEFVQRQDERIRVETATSANEGLERLSQNGIHCIISDYDMPGQTGIEFLEAVRNDHPDIPFILFTGKGSEEIASDAISAGVTDYLQKGGGTDQYAVLANRIGNAVEGHRARQDAERNARRLEQIRKNATDVIYITTPRANTIEFVSDAYAEVWGRSISSLKQDLTTAVNAIHSEDRERVRTALAAQQENPDEYQETYRVVQPDGDIRWVTDRSSGVYENGELVQILGVATDITQLKEYEEQLREEQAFNEAALETAVDFYWGIDLDGYVNRWSDGDGSVTGYSSSEAIGLHTSTFHPDDHFPRIEQAIDELRETGSVTVRADLLTKQGERIPYEFAGTTIADEEGTVESMCGIGREITDQTE